MALRFGGGLFCVSGDEMLGVFPFRDKQTQIGELMPWNYLGWTDG